MFVTHRCVNFGMEKVEIPSDGVVTGHGMVDGRPVFAFAQDFTSRAGSLGEMHAKKICKVMDLALKAGVPFVGIQRLRRRPHSGRGGCPVRLRRDLLPQLHLASGVIPQISAIMGPTAGGAVYSPAMTDYIFMVKNTSYMFITGPEVIKAVTGEEISFEDLGGAMAHNEKSGVAHFACETDEDAIEQIKTPALLSARQQHGRPAAWSTPATTPDACDAGPGHDHSGQPQPAYDMKDVIRVHRGQRRIF